jgi:putative ABC transport system permease protein
VGGVLGTAPWLRGPVLLVRRPTVFLAVLAATAVLSVAACSGVLFLSTLGTASLQVQSRDDCVEGSAPQFILGARPDRLAAVNGKAESVMRGASSRGQSHVVDLLSVNVQSGPVTLFAREGAIDHVQKLTPDTGRVGAWFPESFAAKLHVAAGDVVTAVDQSTIPVAGIYRDLSPDPFHLTDLPSYWCAWKDIILQKLSDAATPPLLLSDVATIAATHASEVHGVEVHAFGALPIKHISIDMAEAADTRVTQAFQDYVRHGSDLALAFRGLRQPDPLQEKIVVAHRVQAGLVGSVVPIDVAATIVALLLVAGAGGYWTTHRAREIRLLSSRGIAPRWIGVKAVLETAPPAVLGLVAGVLVARLLVQRIGPTSVFAPGTGTRSVLAAAGATAAGLLIIGVIGVFGARERDDRPRGRGGRWWRPIPWELALLGIAAWIGHSLRSDPGVQVDHTIVRIRASLVLFPLFGSAGTLLLVARISWLALPGLARIAPRLSRAAYLALRRMGRSRAITIGLLIGTALPCALLTYASTVGAGVRHEITRKYQTNLGAPEALNLIGVRAATPELSGHGTAVVTYGPNAAHLPDGRAVSVLGVDPATFDRFAYLSTAQRRLVERLNGGRRRAILINAPAGTDVHAVQRGRTSVPIHVIARSEVFPGLRSGAYPMIVINRAILQNVDPNADRGNQAWTTPGQVAALSTALARDGYEVLSRVDTNVLVNSTGLLPVTWIVGYLRALAILIGAVAATGLVFGLGARTRQRTVAYVLSRRMGMTQPTHIRSLLIELGLIVGLGWIVGVAAGAAGFGLILNALDVYPALPPGADFAFPTSIVLGTAAGATLAVAVAAIATHQAAQRANPADVLRLE